MKKILGILVLSLLLCNTGFAERVTWGFVGDDCKKFNLNKNKFQNEFDNLFKTQMRGFLTGYNMYVALNDGGTDKMKILDHNSIDYAYSTIVEYCRKKPDGQVFFGLIDYYNSLPN